jgi:hypothetical protein
MSDNRHMPVAMQRLVDLISMVTQQYVTTQQYRSQQYVTMQQYQSGHNYGKKLRFLLIPP